MCVFLAGNFYHAQLYVGMHPPVSCVELVACLRGFRRVIFGGRSCGYCALNRWYAAGGDGVVGGTCTCLSGDSRPSFLRHATPSYHPVIRPCRGKSVKGHAGIGVLLAGNFCRVKLYVGWARLFRVLNQRHGCEILSV